MAKSIFQISPLDAEISRQQNDSFGAVDLSLPDLPAIGAPPPLPEIAVHRPAASARTPGAVKPPATLIPVFEQAALRHDVPLNILMALGEQESRYNPMAVGTPTQWGRAKGVMQYLDSTASNLGINPFDPKQSIDAAAKQIRERLDKGYSMADAVKEHFAGPDRKKWGAKTRVYGDEVLGRAARLKQELAPRYAGRAGDGAAALERISRVKPPMSVEESRARDNVPPGTDDRGWLETGAGLIADAGNLLASGVNMAAEDLTELVGRIPVLGKGITAAVDRADRFITGKGTQEIFEDTQKWVDGNFTQEMRAARQKQFVLENEDGYAFGPAWSDPRTYMSGLLESVPEMVLTMGPAGRLAKGAYTGAIAKGLGRAEAAKRAATVATVAGGVAEGLLGGAQSGREVRREVMEMPRETLERSDALKDMMSDGLSFEEARAALAEDASTQAFIVSGTLTGMFGGFGDRALAKIITGPAQGRIKSAALGALSEGLLEEMPQSVGQQVSQNLAVRDADPTRSAGQGAVNAGVTGAVIGGMMGGGLGAVAPRAGDVDEQPTAPPAPTPEAAPPPPAPSGPLGRALARATAAAEAVPIAVPEPLPPEIAQQPMVLATDGTEYPVTLIGETPDAVWVKTETGEELQIPRADMDAGTVELFATPVPAADAATVDEPLTVSSTAQPPIEEVNPFASDAQTAQNPNPGRPEPSAGNSIVTPSAVKDGLTIAVPGNLQETVTSSPSQEPVANSAADLTEGFKGIAGGISAGLIDMYQAQASAGSVKDKSGTVSPVLQVAKKVRARRGDVELARDEVEAIARAVDGVSATGQERQVALQSVVDQFTPEMVDPETGEILPADPAPPAPSAEQDPAAAPPATEPNETELRARLKYLSSQARSGNGWTPAMVAEKKAISAVIDSMAIPSTVGSDAVVTEKPAPALPRELAGAKPRYNFGDQSFVLDFANDVEKAAFIAAQEIPSKRDTEFVEFVRAATGLDEAGVREMGAQVRQGIKDLARGSQPGRLVVPPLVTAPPSSALDAAGAAQPDPIETAAAQAAMSPLNDLPEPSQAQKDAGNYKLGHAIVGGLDVSIENPAGTSRRPEWPPLKHSYGYVKRSEGADGDHVDVFLGPKAADPTNPVFIVDQVNKDGSFDEHKVMVGFADKGAARRGYLANYEKGWQGLGDITPMPFEQFKGWVKDPTRTIAPAGTKVAPIAPAEPIAPAPVTPSEPSAELTPSPRASSPAAPPPPSNRLAPVARREVSKKHPNPFVRTGERYRLSRDVDYLRAGEEYAVESAGKRTAYFRDPRNGGGTSINNIIEKAIRDGVMVPVEATTPTASPSQITQARASGDVAPNVDQSTAPDTGIGPASMLTFLPRQGAPGVAVSEDDGFATAVFRDGDGIARAAVRLAVSPAAKDSGDEVSTFVEPSFRRRKIATRLYDALATANYPIDAVSGTGDVTPDGAAFLNARRVAQQTAISQVETTFSGNPQNEANGYTARDVGEMSPNIRQMVERADKDIEGQKRILDALDRGLILDGDMLMMGNPRWALERGFADVGPVNGRRRGRLTDAGRAKLAELNAAPANQSVPSPPLEPTQEADKYRRIEEDFTANRAALKAFKMGETVEYDLPGTFTQPDGSKREGRLVRGVVTEVLSKEQGTLKVTEPSGAWANVGARMLRKQAPETPAAESAGTLTVPLAAFSQNKVFTADKVEAARARLREKMNRINSGIDPEVLVDGMTIAGAYIESGVRKFADYAKAMRADFGPRITPYLLSFWEGARNYPGLDTKGMTSPDVSRTQYARLLEAGLPVEEATAIGTELARPKAKANAPTVRTLRADWGVEHIDGWTPIEGGQNSPTDFGLKGGLKDAFLADATAYLRAVAATLRPLGFVPYVNARGKDENPVSRNAAGPAVSGDVSLYLRNPDTGAQVYGTVGATSMRGAVPTSGAGVSVMYRVSLKGGDKHAVAGVNRWAPTDLTAIDLADTIAWEAGRNKPELTRDAVAELEPAGQGVNRRGVPPVQGGREPDAQPGDAPADIEPVGAAQPADVVEPASAGADGQDGVRVAAADVGSREGAAEPGLPDNGRARDGGARGTAAGARNADAGRQRSADDAPGRAAEPEGQVSRSDDAAGRGKRGRDAGQLSEPDLFAPAIETDSVALSPAPPPSPARSGPGNFSIANPLDIVGGGPVARFDRNRLAIETYNAIRDEGRSATADEQRVLAGYTGWGSFGQELFQGSWDRPMPKDNWKDRDRWLRDHMGRDEWESAQRSITNAHYTDPPTVMAMWVMMQRMGFQGGRVLEPSMGIGNFFGMMPADIASRTTLAGIELDSLTGGMAQLLYPDANIRVMGYQESKTPDDFYDAVIGNWPFENTVIADRRYDRLSPYLHDYFFLKALDQVRPGGIVMGITSSGTMDKKATGIRRELAKKADLVAAFRLPSGAFAEYAGTKVVTDIVILRKRAAPISLADDAGWINSVPYQTPHGEVFLNEYYVANPTNVVGTVDFGHGTTRGRPGLIVHRPDDMSAQLQRIVEAVPTAAYTADSRAQQVSYIANHTADREGALTRTKDGLFVVRGEQLAPAAEVERFALKDTAKTAARVNQLERLIDMRGKYAALIEAKRTGEPEAARKALKRDYDGFVKAHGTMAGSFGLSYMRKIDDPFYPSLAALEIAGKPAAILSRSTTRTAPAIANPTITEAFVLERNAAVNPSLDAIAARAAVAPEDAKAQLLESGAVFELPNGDVVPSDMYLSGNVREKLRQARAAVAEGMDKLQRNVDALVAVVPADVPYFKIETQLGATWIAPNIYAEFVGHMLGLPDSKGVEVRYNGGRWTVRVDDRAKARPEARTGFGTEEYGFQRLVNAAFSNQSVTIRRKDSDGGSYVDHAATEEVNGKIAEMRTKFADWLWSDPERRVAVEAEYNEVRNAFATPRFDGSFLRFEGMALSLGNGPFDLRQHQVDAIWRALVTRRSLNAHEVGTGKTFTMGGIAIESRRYGIAKKPLILAHNANSKSVAAEIQQMYPASKILYIDNLTPATIDVKMRQIANDDWDAIVVPHSLIDRFAFREDTLMAMAREEIAALEEEAYAAAEEDGADLKAEMLDDPEELKKLRSPTAKELVKMRQRIIETIKKQSSRASREGAISFEELGVDMLMVDEAHEFKKPPISTRMKMKGLNTGTSDRSIALSFLTRYVRAQNAGGNIHLFTGTPVTNTLTEVFHMMRYIMAEEMQAAGIDQWDGWFGSFAREVMDVEQNAAAEYEAVTRLAGFINVPELRRMIGQYMDTVFAADMPEMQPRRTASGKTMADELSESERAELLNGRTEGAQDRPYKKVINVTSDLTPQQKVIFEQLRGYAKAWRGFTGKERKDAMIAGSPESPIITEGLANKASFDVRLYDGEVLAGQEGKAGDDEGSKASRVIANVKEVFDSSPLATQVIFAEQGFSNRVTRSLGRSDDGKRQTRTIPYFSTIRDIVERLVQSGIPRAQIAVVDGGTSKEKRKEIAAAMNAAKIRVVIGSTATLGVGVNMQKNLRAMHHMDAPWMPGDLEQRNGRGQRQGNQWNTVLEYRYLTDRLDGRRWQVLAIKQRFITAFLKADDSARVIEGEAAADEQSDILQSFAEAAGDPRILIREKLRKQLDGAQRRERLHTQGIANALGQARMLSRAVTETEAELADVERRGTVAAVETLVAENAGKGFSITVDGKTFDKRKDADEAIAKWGAFNLRTGDAPVAIGKFGRYELLLGWPGMSTSPELRLTIDSKTFSGASVQGLEQSLRKFGPDIERRRARMGEQRATIGRLEAVAGEPFHMAGDLDRYAKALTDLEVDIQLNPVPPPAWLRTGAPVDTGVGWNGAEFTVSGHRWTADGWFVLASDGNGDVTIPYLEARDAQGIAIYDERPFEAPQLIDKEVKSDPAQSAESTAAHSVGPATGGGFVSADGLRQHLLGGAHAPSIDRLLTAGKLVIHGSGKAMPGAAGRGNVQAVTTRDGRVHLAADRLTSETALPVLLHEMFHAGARPLIGNANWQTAMQRLETLYRSAALREGTADRGNQAYWKRALARVEAAAPPAGQEVEEFAAYAIEERAQAPAGVVEAIDRLTGALKAWMLRRFAVQVGAIRPAQLQSLAAAALRAGITAPRDGTFMSRVVPRERGVDAATPGMIANLVTKAMDGKTSVLGVIPLRPLLSEMASRLPAAGEYLTLKQAMDQTRDQWHSRSDAVAQPWLKFRMLHRADNRQLMDLMHEATLAGVDPAAPFTSILTPLDRKALSEGPGTEAYDEAADKARRDESRKTDHGRLGAAFAALPVEGKRIYADVRDTYRALSAAFEQVLLDNLSKALDIKFRQAKRAYDAELIRIAESDMAADARELAQAKAEREWAKQRQLQGWAKGARMTRLRAFFETNNMSGPYFPLARFGNFFVTVRDGKSDQVISFSRFEKPAEQQAFAKQMKEAGHGVTIGVLDDGGALKAQVDARFVTDIESILEGADVSEGVRDAVWQRWLETMPDMSIRTSRIHRKGRAGFSSDAIRAFGHHMFHGSHQLARLKYALDLDETVALARDQAKTMPDPVRAGLIVNEMARRNQFIMNPTGGPLAQALTSAAFIYHLSVSPAAAMVNTAQTAVMGIPILAAYDGRGVRSMARATFELNKALRDFAMGRGHAGRSSSLTTAERAAMDEAYDTGLIERTQSHDLAGVGETGVEYSAMRTKVMGAISWAFHHTERLNREVTFLAAYRMARKKGEPHNMAIDRGAELTWKTHFDYQNTSRPRVMQSDTAKVLLTFRNFQVNMLWRLFRDAHQAVKGGTKQERREARMQLGGVTGMMMLSAGVRGTWMYGIAMVLASLLFGDDAEDDFSTAIIEALGPQLGGMALNGVPGHTLGVDISQRIGMPDLWFRSPDRQLEGATEFDYWAMQFLGAGVGVLRNAWTGASMIADGKVYRGVETMMPKFAKDLMRSYRYMDEGARTLKGDPIIEDMPAADALKQALGFMPAELAERYDRNRSMKNKEQRIIEQRGTILSDYDQAMREEGDTTAIEARIDRFNEKNPDYPITVRTIRQSMKSRQRMRDTKIGGVNLNPKLADRLQEEAVPLVYEEEAD